MRVQIDLGAASGIVNRSGIVGRVAREVRDIARVNASEITDKTDAIAVEHGRDALGSYADVGYLRKHPGFFLWWHEVGTRHHPPTPHLRPALQGITLLNGGGPSALVDYTTRDGRTRQATQAQVDNWTRGRRT